MLKKCLSYWLVLLIAMQSITVIADTPQAHQPEEQQLSFEHEYAQTPTEIALPSPLEKSTQFPNDGLDCYYHCYCQSSYN